MVENQSLIDIETVETAKARHLIWCLIPLLVTLLMVTSYSISFIRDRTAGRKNTILRKLIAILVCVAMIYQFVTISGRIVPWGQHMEFCDIYSKFMILSYIWVNVMLYMTFLERSKWAQKSGRIRQIQLSLAVLTTITQVAVCIFVLGNGNESANMCVPYVPVWMSVYFWLGDLGFCTGFIILFVGPVLNLSRNIERITSENGGRAREQGARTAMKLKRIAMRNFKITAVIVISRTVVILSSTIIHLVYPITPEQVAVDLKDAEVLFFPGTLTMFDVALMVFVLIQVTHTYIPDGIRQLLNSVSILFAEMDEPRSSTHTMNQPTTFGKTSRTASLRTGRNSKITGNSISSQFSIDGSTLRKNGVVSQNYPQRQHSLQRI